MKKRFTEEQIIGFLREAEAGMPVAELCRKHAFSEASYYLWRSNFSDKHFALCAIYRTGYTPTIFPLVASTSN